MRVTLLHNPGSGDGDDDPGELQELLERSGHEVSYRSLADDGWKMSLENPGDVLVVAGGDGTIRKVLTAIGPCRTTVTLFPSGSANNVARTLGFESDDAGRLLAGWEAARVRAFDLWEIAAGGGRRTFVEMAGGGLFGELFARARAAHEEPSGEEKIDAGLELLTRVLEEARPARWELELDGVRVREELLAVVLMNVRELGPNLLLAPSADPADGHLEVVLVREPDREQLGSYVARCLEGNGFRAPELETTSARSVVLHPPPGARLHADDTLFELPGPVAVRRASTSVDVLVPAVAAPAS